MTISFNQCKQTRNREAGNRTKLNPLFDVTLKNALLNADVQTENINDKQSLIYVLSSDDSNKLLSIRKEIMTADKNKFSELLEATKKDICRFIVVRYFQNEKKNGNIAVNRTAYHKESNRFLIAMDSKNKENL